MVCRSTERNSLHRPVPASVGNGTGYRTTYTNTTDEPREVYYFNGIAVGDVSNNGTSDTDYVQSIENRFVEGQGGGFRFGATTGTSYADFDQSYDPIDGLSYAATASRYTVQSGDTLGSIVWLGSDQIAAKQSSASPMSVVNNCDSFRR